MLEILSIYLERKELKITEDLNSRIHYASPLEHTSMQGRPRTQTGLPRGKGGTVDLTEELAQSTPLVDTTSIKERTSGCLNGAGINEKTILSPFSSIITSSSQLLRGIMP